MKEKFNLYLQFFLWLFSPKIVIYNEQKQIVCPVMLKYVGRWKKDVILCDIPIVREKFTEHGEVSCTRGCSECLPRKAFPEVASEETAKRPARKVSTSIHSTS